MPDRIRYRLTPEAQRVLAPLLGEARVADGVLDEQELESVPRAALALLSEFRTESFDERTARMARARGELGGQAASTPLSAAELTAAAHDFREAAAPPAQALRGRAEAALLDWRSLRAPGAVSAADARDAAERSRNDARAVAALVDPPGADGGTSRLRLQRLGLSAEQADLLLTRGVEVATAHAYVPNASAAFTEGLALQLQRMGLAGNALVEAVLDFSTLLDEPRGLDSTLWSLAEAEVPVRQAFEILKSVTDVRRTAKSGALTALAVAFAGRPADFDRFAQQLLDGVPDSPAQKARLDLAEAVVKAGAAPEAVGPFVRALAAALGPHVLQEVNPGLVRALLEGGFPSGDAVAYVQVATELRLTRQAGFLVAAPGQGAKSLTALAGVLRQMRAEATQQAGRASTGPTAVPAKGEPLVAPSPEAWLAAVGDAMQGGATYESAKAVVAAVAARPLFGAGPGSTSTALQVLGQATRRGYDVEAARQALSTTIAGFKTLGDQLLVIDLLYKTNADVVKASSDFVGEVSRAVNETVSAVESHLAQKSGPATTASGSKGLGKQDLPVLSAAVVLIGQRLHDRESESGDTDVARTALFQSLPAIVAFQGLGMGGQLYTSSFLKLLERWKVAAEPEGIAAWLDRAKVGSGPMLTLEDNLARFHRGEEAFALRKVILPHLLSRLSDAQPADGLAGVQVSLVAEIYARMDPGERLQFQKQLLAEYAAHPKMPGLPYLLRYLHENGAVGPEAEKVAKALPALAPEDFRERLGRWLKDGVLSARLFFYPDEKSFDEALEVFAKAGFTVTSRDADNVVLERANERGPTWRISMTRDLHADRRAALSDASVDIVAHRGHSFHFEKTFPPEASIDYGGAPKLLIGGSCGSLRSMTEKAFMENYGTHSLIADVGTGEGTVNNQVLLDLFAGLSATPQGWKDVGLQKYAGEDIVPPDHLIWGLRRYARRLGG